MELNFMKNYMKMMKNMEVGHIMIMEILGLLKNMKIKN